MPGSRLHVHLSRDSFNTPWGFRLQGGKDLRQPLTVQRVFSNSPAEGELQRGDVILSINNRDAGELTHKHAQDLIKHGGGQVQLVVNRPPPGTSLGPLSPPIITHQPRAPSLSPSNPNASFRQIPIQIITPSPKPRTDSGYHQPTSKAESYPLHVQATLEPHVQQQRPFLHQSPTTPTSPIPSWAAQQFTPKKVLTLAKLGGRGQDLGTAYATLPRRLSSANHGGRWGAQGQGFQGTDEAQEERLATGPIPKVCRLRNLGGGGREFGSAFGSATLPRSGVGRRLSHPVSSSPAGGHGFHPTKVTLNKFGGGGRDLGSDFGQRTLERSEPRHDRHDMLSRVQNSLDNIVLSPRSPDVHTSSPFYQPYTTSAQPLQQAYTPTGLLLEQQQQQNQGEALPPVWERRQQFQQGPVQRSGNAPVYKSAPKVPKPQPGPSSYGNFGIDYSHPTNKQPQAGWRPAPQFHPSQAPVKSAPQQYKPQYAPPPTAAKPVSPSSYAPVHSAQPPWQRKQEDEDNGGTPAWRSSLKGTGVKPWDTEVGYTNEQAPIRSVPYTPAPIKSPVASGPFSPAGAQSGGSENGPKVVHLQYNSPLHLYSNQNVAETLKGQTQAMAGQPQHGPAPVNEAGERDWSQSAVLRFISQEDSKKGRQPAPPVSPKPQYSQVHSVRPVQPFYHDHGATEF